jgi:hypothetical protein
VDQEAFVGSKKKNPMDEVHWGLHLIDLLF